MGEHLGPLLNGVTLGTTFPESGRVGRGLDKIARMIKLRSDLESERDAFITVHHGYDTHFNTDISGLLTEVNDAIEAFYNEMVEQDIWDGITIVTTSDFGRTLNSNGQGTDHAWGGHNMIFGGSINGGRIFGQFPESLHEDNELHLGNGVMLPTSPWESMWKPIAEWLGVESNQMDEVLPNAANFPDETHFTKLYV